MFYYKQLKPKKAVNQYADDTGSDNCFGLLATNLNLKMLKIVEKGVVLF